MANENAAKRILGNSVGAVIDQIGHTLGVTTPTTGLAILRHPFLANSPDPQVVRAVESRIIRTTKDLKLFWVLLVQE